MVKKIGLITLFILFAGVLIYGAVNRTAAKSETAARNETENLAANERHANEVEAQPLSSQGSLGQQEGQGKWGKSNQDQGGQGQDGQGQDNQDPGNPGQGIQGQSANSSGNNGQGQGRNQQSEASELQALNSITGVVIQAPAAGIDMIVETAAGEVLIGTGPGYLAEQGFVVLAGDSISASGTWEDAEFKAAEITLLADGTSIVLRDEWGRPMWSGAGRNAQNRQNEQSSG